MSLTPAAPFGIRHSQSLNPSRRAGLSRRGDREDESLSEAGSAFTNPIPLNPRFS